MIHLLIGLSLLTASPNYTPPTQLQNLKEEQQLMEPSQLRELITNTLRETQLYSESAVELLMLTAAVESQLGYYIKQKHGPALGIFQMEPATAQDIWENYLTYNSRLQEQVEGIHTMAYIKELEWDLKYAILMARIHYLRVPSALPPADDIQGLAWYWKKHYNTIKGKGTVPKAIAAYQRYAGIL